MGENPSATLPATVEKIIKSPYPGISEKAEITVEGADLDSEYLLPES